MPRSAAQGFADHLDDLLNRTATDGRLSLVADPGSDARFLLQRMVGKRSAALVRRPSPLRLFIRQAVEVVRGHRQTASYIYRFQAGVDAGDWLLHAPRGFNPHKPGVARIGTGNRYAIPGVADVKAVDDVVPLKVATHSMRVIANDMRRTRTREVAPAFDLYLWTEVGDGQDSEVTPWLVRRSQAT